MDITMHGATKILISDEENVPHPTRTIRIISATEELTLTIFGSEVDVRVGIPRDDILLRNY